MKTEFIDFLKQHASVSAEDEQLLIKFLKIKKVKKGKFLNTAGTVCKDVYFIVEGITRYFVLEEDGNEYTSLFMVEGDFCTDAFSFYQKKEAYGSLQAETDCKLIHITHDVFELMGLTLPYWHNVFNQTSSIFFQSIIGLNRKMLHLEAKDAYLYFIEIYPNIENRVPLQDIASYLGITQYSLSRIRKELIVED